MQEAVVLPPSYLAERYFKNCRADASATLASILAGTPVDCFDRSGTGNAGGAASLPEDDPCLPFCSFREMKEWVEARYQSEIERTTQTKLDQLPEGIDPLVYDLKYAVDLLDNVRTYFRPDLGDDDKFNLRDSVLDLSRIILPQDSYRLDLAGSTSSLPMLERLDICQCEHALRCPNGTTSNVQSSNLYDCMKRGDEVLQRLVPIDPVYLVNATERRVLADAFERTKWGLGSLELLGGEQSVISIDMRNVSANFTYGEHFQLAIYVDCEPCPPHYRCKYSASPLTCSYPSLDDQLGYGYMCEDCCSCTDRSLPEWVTFNKKVLPYLDNKHAYVQITLTPLKPTSVLIVFELLHGQYYRNFKSELVGITQYYKHVPTRADYYPSSEGNRYGFYSMITFEDLDGFALPYNLPMTYQRVEGTANTYQLKFEDDIFLDRPADIRIGDPTYFLNSMSETDSAYSGILSVDEVYIPRPLRNRTYPDLVRDPTAAVEQDLTWWTIGDVDPIESIFLHYLPWFSNCEGYDSHILISKLLEDHPDCAMEPYGTTVFVN